MSHKVAISLPDDLYEEIERLRMSSHQDRSTWIQEAARKYIAGARRADAIAAYVRGYDEMPETDEEIAMADAGSARMARYLEEDERSE